LLKYFHCDFGALFTAILTVSTLAITVPTKPRPVFQKATSTLPTSILVCAQALYSPPLILETFSFPVSSRQNASDKQYRSAAKNIRVNP